MIGGSGAIGLTLCRKDQAEVCFAFGSASKDEPGRTLPARTCLGGLCDAMMESWPEILVDC